MGLFSDNFYDAAADVAVKSYKHRLEEDARRKKKELDKANAAVDISKFAPGKYWKALEEANRALEAFKEDMAQQYGVWSELDDKRVFNYDKLPADMKKQYDKLQKNIDTLKPKATLEREKQDETNLKNIQKQLAAGKAYNQALEDASKAYAEYDPDAKKLEYSNTIKSAGDFIGKQLGRVKLSPDMYGALTNMANINSAAKQAGYLRDQANLHDIQAGTEQQYAQKWGQIASDDYRRQAEQNAIAGATQENTQKIGQAGNVTGANAYVMKDTGKADYNTYMQRQDAARQKAMEGYREMYGTQQVASEERAGAEKTTDMARTDALYNTESRNLALAKSKQDAANKNITVNVNPPNPQDTNPQDTNPQDTNPQDTNPQDTNPSNEQTKVSENTSTGNTQTNVQNKGQNENQVAGKINTRVDKYKHYITGYRKAYDKANADKIKRDELPPSSKNVVEVPTLGQMYRVLNGYVNRDGTIPYLYNNVYRLVYTGPDPVKLRAADAGIQSQEDYNVNINKIHPEVPQSWFITGDNDTNVAEYNAKKWLAAAKPLVESGKYN